MAPGAVALRALPRQGERDGRTIAPKAAREFPEVSYAITQLGRNDTGTDPWTPSHIEAPVGLKPYSTWPKGETRDMFLSRFNARMQKLPVLSAGVSQPIIDMVYDVIGGAHTPLVVRIIGDDFKELRRIGDGVVNALNTVPGTASASIFQEPPIPQIAVDIDRAAAARYGINVSDITSLIQTGVGGAPVSTVYVADRTYDVTVRFPENTRNSPEALGSLILTTSGGAQIPLSEVAHIRPQTGEATITHEMGKRELLVGIDNRDRALSDYLKDAQAKIGQTVHFDLAKYHLEWGGQFESEQRAQARLTLTMGIVLALMAIFLFAEFGKMRQTILLLTVVPLATLGGLIALHLRGQTLNVASAVGFIALFGVAVQNGIIMVSNINRVRGQGKALREAVLSGAVERFRPVLMTATVATVGMLPAALATGVGTDVQRNLATVVVGRSDTRHPAHALHPSDLLLRAGAVGGKACGNAAGRSRGGRVMRVSIPIFSHADGAPIALRKSLCIAMAFARPVSRPDVPWVPTFTAPSAPGVDRYMSDAVPGRTISADVRGGEAQTFTRGMDIPGEWWTLFHSEALNDLIRQALKANPDLEAAQAALRGAWENVYAQRGAYLPSVDANFNPTRQKIGSALTSPLASNANIYSLHTAQVSVAYTLDVFGVNRRQVESLEAQADSQRFELEAAYLTLTSNVVAGAVEEAALRGQIATAKRIIDVQSQSLELLRRQYGLGQIAEADVVAQEAALAQTQATLPPLQKQLAQQRDLLARLAGRFPSETLAEKFELASLDLPQELPLSLPSKLVAQRPDVRSAEGQLHAASAGIGVAIANRLPNITLSGNVGSVATQVGQLFTSGTGFWALAGNVTQPVFQGGTLLHRQRAAQAAYDQAAAQYRGTVLTAFQNVADALYAIQCDADALKAAVAAETAAAKSLAIARTQLELGDVSYLALLNAEQTYQQAVMSKVQALANRYADTAALFQALGGGWWNRSDARL